MLLLLFRKRRTDVRSLWGFLSEREIRGLSSIFGAARKYGSGWIGQVILILSTTPSLRSEIFVTLWSVSISYSVTSSLTKFASPQVHWPIYCSCTPTAFIKTLHFWIQYTCTLIILIQPLNPHTCSTRIITALVQSLTIRYTQTFKHKF